MCRSPTWSPTSSSVSVPGASCTPGPSPNARALRLDGLRADGAESLRALLGKLGDPPWDAAIADGEPHASLVAAEGFEPYARVMVMARALEGMIRPAPVAGVTVDPQRNAWAEDYARAEAEAMEGLAVFAEMGQPTGYESAEGFDAAVVAREGDTIVGFAQAMLPEGWINWIGVVPGARRRGIARLLIGELARLVTEARGTHLAVMIEPGTPAQGFFAAAGFRERGARRTLMIRRA